MAGLVIAMTKKHFMALADELKAVVAGDAAVGCKWDAEAVRAALCRFMRSQNSNFDERRWRDYLAGKSRKKKEE